MRPNAAETVSSFPPNIIFMSHVFFSSLIEAQKGIVKEDFRSVNGYLPEKKISFS